MVMQIRLMTTLHDQNIDQGVYTQKNGFQHGHVPWMPSFGEGGGGLWPWCPVRGGGVS
jgi:hypothetical protein